MSPHLCPTNRTECLGTFWWHQGFNHCPAAALLSPSLQPLALAQTRLGLSHSPGHHPCHHWSQPMHWAFEAWERDWALGPSERGEGALAEGLHGLYSNKVTVFFDINSWLTLLIILKCRYLWMRCCNLRTGLTWLYTPTDSWLPSCGSSNPLLCFKRVSV